MTILKFEHFRCSKIHQSRNYGLSKLIAFEFFSSFNNKTSQDLYIKWSGFCERKWNLKLELGQSINSRKLSWKE